MDVVNFPGIIAKHGLLSSPQVDLAKDLILIGKKMGPQRDGTQYENMAITIAQFANLIGGGNETLAQTLALGNTTGGNNIIFSGTDFAIFQSGLFTGRLSRLSLTGNQAWNLPDKSGTIALLSDIPTPPTTLYSGDSTIISAIRNVTVGTTLNFLYGAAGVNGSLQLTSGGYFKNTTATLGNYFEYNNASGLFSTVTTSHTYTGFRTDKNGNWLEMVHDGTRGYFNTNNYMEWYTNNTAIYAGQLSILGNWGFGGAAGSAKVTVTGSGNTAATINQYWQSLGTTRLMQLNDDGNLGLNSAPLLTDRFRIVAGAGYDGAINISAFNLANNGYGILLQGGSGSTTYNGFWSDANGGATADNRAFLGIAGYNGVQNNYGAEFRARQGSIASIGVWGRALGGDSVVPGFAAVGVQGSVESVVATNRRAGYFYSLSDVNNGLTYGVKSEVSAQGINGLNYGIHSRVNGNGATVVNYAGWFQADGGTGATNYALVTNGGNIGFGTTTPSNQALVELVSTSQALLIMRMTAAQAGAITPSNGMMLYVTDTSVTFPTVGGGFYKYQAGAWLPF